MRIKRSALAGVVLVSVVSGCGSAGSDQALAPAPAAETAAATCGSTGTITGSFDGRADQQPPRPGDVGTSSIFEPIPGDPEVLLRRLFPRLVAVTVVAREAPVATSEETDISVGRSAVPHKEARAAAVRPVGTVQGPTFRVLRPTGLRVDRVIRGSLDQQCLEVDIPGGSAGSFNERSGYFPDQLSLGDRLLLLYCAACGDLGFGEAIKADAEGNVILPFATRTKVNLDEWVPPPYEGRPTR